MYASRMFDMWSTVTSKLEAHNNSPVQTNVQANGVQTQSSGSIKGKKQKKKTNIFNYVNNVLD